MSPELSRNFCWSCGGKDGHHRADCESAIQITVTPPSEPPAHCGGSRSRHPNALVLDYSDSKPNLEPELHYCCKCYKPYKATFNEWINGTCPHCGAKGA